MTEIMNTRCYLIDVCEISYPKIVSQATVE